MVQVFVDADACPVKAEIYRVARRCGLTVTLVANSPMRIPDEDWVVLQVVKSGFDAADDWIATHVEADDIVVTADILLANRCLAAGARVLGPKGKLFTTRNIGAAVATRDLLTDLRGSGEITGGPPPVSAADRSRFLQQFDTVVQAILKSRKGTA